MTRAPLKLSREMKLLLLLLLMVALIGAWYVWTNNRTLAALPSSTGTSKTGTEATDTDTGTLPSTAAGPATGTEAGAAPDSGGVTASNDGAASGTPTTGDTVAQPGSAPVDGVEAGTGGAATAAAGTSTSGASKSGPAGTDAATSGQPGAARANAGQPTTGAAPSGTGLAAGADTVPLIPASGASDQNSADAGNAGALAVQPNRPVEIEVIPPFPTPEVPSASNGTATPGGINPQASIASVPSNNPFRPLSVDRSAEAASAPAAASGLAGSGRPSNPQTGTPGGSVQTTPITPSTNAGPLAISPIPGAGGSTSVTPGSLSGLPTIPGADGSTGLGSPSAGLNIPGSGVTSGSAIPGGTGTISSGNTGSGNTGSGNTVSGGTVSGNAPGRTISGNSGDSGVTVIGGSAAGTTVSGTAASRNPNAAGAPGRTNGRTSARSSAQTNSQGAVVITAPKPPKPIVPPIAGVNVPSVNRVPVTPSSLASSTAAANGAGRPGSTSAASGTPVPGTPQVITSLGQGAGDETGAATAASRLDQFVQKRQLVFNAAVLGPINTAIFRGQDGYVVVAVGQTLPDSQVTVREVNATTAVLSLGTDLKTLELDQR